MDNPYDEVLIYLRRFMYNEKQDLKLMLKEPDKNKYYIQFKQGKIFALTLNIEAISKMKKQHDRQTEMDSINDNF